MTLAAADFTYVTDVVRRQSAIDLKPGKEYLVESRLAPLARSLGEKDVAGVVARMRRGDAPLTDRVVDALTTNETSWFRDVHPFQAFTDHILPAVLAVRREVTVWSAACSSGQEAYSLAMLLLERLPAAAAAASRVVGTDIAQSMVDKARAGRYSQLEVGRGLPARYLAEHFGREGADWVVRPGVRALVRFERGNLALPPAGIPTCDVVFLRNVLIYFDQEMKRRVLANVQRALRPGGFLVLGGTEGLGGLDAAFSRVDLGRTSVFRLGPAGGAA